VNSHALRVLEFSKLLEILSGHTQTAGGRALALSLRPDLEREAVERELKTVEEARRWLVSSNPPPALAMADVGPTLKRLGIPGSSAGAQELFEIAAFLRLSNSLHGFKKYLRSSFPLLSEALSGLERHDALAEKLSVSVDSSGGVLDGASEALQRIRKRQGVLRERISTRLEKIRLSAGRGWITLRHGRYVVPVARDQSSTLKGIVLGESTSGATVFVEPIEIVDLNNELAALETEEKREEKRILAELSRAIFETLESVQVNLDIVSRLDLVLAKAHWAEESAAATPAVSEDGGIRIVRGRHPLLERVLRSKGGTIVPLDFSMSPGKKIVIISGPNMGGKTVALKTLGIFSAMVRAGFPLPAGPGTEMPVFQELFVDIGDEQSIEDELSTFSSHLRQLAEVVKRAGPRTLVLLDELGAGTDPSEGQALARAVIERLSEAGASVVATTHMGGLRLMSGELPSVENASMEFDLETLRPTYVFRLGVPGRSRAIDMARGFGLDESLCERAYELMGEGDRALNSLIDELDRTLSGMRSELEAATAERQELEEARHDYEKRVKSLEQEAEEERRKLSSQSRELVRETERLLHEVSHALKTKRVEQEKLREAKALLELRRRFLRAVGEKPEAKVKEAGARESFRPGQRVLIRGLNCEAVVTSHDPGSGRIRLRRGNVSFEADDSEVVPSEESAPEQVAGATEQDVGEGFDTEIDIRGSTVEEAERILSRFIDRAVLNGVSEISIIHGKGTGALRKGVSEFLRRRPEVSGSRLGQYWEGGDGVTIVRLKS